MSILDFLRDNILFLDGGMGTLLQKRGLAAGELPEVWNVTHPDVIEGIHLEYYRSGSNVVSANTFGANSLKFSDAELDNVIGAAVENARRAAEKAGGERFVALDIGPTGHLLKPYGDLDFEEAVDVFAKTVRIGVKYGVDLIFIETMNDLAETKAALLAAKENSCLPVFVSNAYSENGCLMTGASPEAVCATVEGMGADAIGVNCSFGPEQLSPIVEKLLQVSSIPVILKPNAGLPCVTCGETHYTTTPADFAREVSRLVKLGVRIAGGCCGTTPEYIKALTDECSSLTPVPTCEKGITWVSSYTHAVIFDEKPLLIGERINPTGKKKLKEALREHNMEYILSEALTQKEKGVHILDVNVGLPDIDEVKLLAEAVCEVQAVCDLPLQLDTSSEEAMEKALRRYIGRPMINSVNGKEESMRRIFPLAKKYGGVIVALTLDEAGIPSTADERVKIAEKILRVAAEYGIQKKDIVFDTLAMTVSADVNAAKVTLEALDRIKHELGCHTVLGVSNVSFGLPCRDTVNSYFFTSAMERGLSSAIMNPYSEDMMRAYYSYLTLHGHDPMCEGYISFMADKTVSTETGKNSAAGVEKSEKHVENSGELTLYSAILKGIRESAAELTKRKLDSVPPLTIVKEDIIPALDEIGRGFEAKKVYLPSLLMSAEAAKYAFEEIKVKFSTEGVENSVKCDFVLATVKGDIHDIGKNIVKLLLENYGYRVHDLGRDVPPSDIVDKVIETNAPLVGLSALMTTTVGAMEETIKELR
ncbi:MAG: homocysteine S-methyltransferase family protein, partial [Clostridia bacterium]|nr:homocysteine S-methyltransferase family protein [Clostridia bacterium]